MLNNFLILILIAFVNPPDAHQTNPYCDVFGVMHEVYNKREADFIVYEEGSETFADILVFDQDNQLFADRQGHWHFVKNRNQARYRLYFTDDPDEAHFSVYFTEYESFAGCNE